MTRYALLMKKLMVLILPALIAGCASPPKNHKPWLAFNPAMTGIVGYGVSYDKKINTLTPLEPITGKLKLREMYSRDMDVDYIHREMRSVINFISNKISAALAFKKLESRTGFSQNIKVDVVKNWIEAPPNKPFVYAGMRARHVEFEVQGLKKGRVEAQRDLAKALHDLGATISIKETKDRGGKIVVKEPRVYFNILLAKVVKNDSDREKIHFFEDESATIAVPDKAWRSELIYPDNGWSEKWYKNLPPPSYQLVVTNNKGDPECYVVFSDVHDNDGKKQAKQLKRTGNTWAVTIPVNRFQADDSLYKFANMTFNAELTGEKWKKVIKVKNAFITYPEYRLVIINHK